MPSLSNNDLQITVKAVDNAAGTFQKVRGEISGVADETATTSTRSNALLDRMQKSWYAFAGIAASAGLALHRAVGFIGDDVEAANELQAAFIGLSSVAKAYNVDQNAAKKAAQDLAKDGLMTVADAATGLKNLLASHFSLDEAIVLMNRFKDSAAFNRQASLGFGEAVRTATEGIKNGNSILVDNAGVTKNLSVILEEAGYSAQDLQHATTDAGVRQALFNGIIKETNAQVGDAQKLTQTFAGKQAELAAQTQIAKQNIGEALQPALLSLLQAITPVITAVSSWAQEHPKLTAVIVFGTTALLALITTLALVGLAISNLVPLFPAFAAVANVSLAGVSRSFALLRTAAMTPIVLPALVLTAAIASIDALSKKISDTYDKIANLQRKTDLQDMVTQAKADYKAGKITKKRLTDIENYAKDPSHNAQGSSVWRGGMTWVGEQGPELVNLPKGTAIHSTAESQKMLAGATKSPTINIGEVHVHNEADEKRLLRYIGMRLQTA